MKKLIVLLLFIIFSIPIFSLSEPSNLHINPDKSIYQQNEPIKGYFSFTIDSFINSTTEIIAKVENKTSLKTLSSVLNSLDIPYKTETYTATSSTTKSLTFSGPQSRTFAIKLPKTALVKSIDMTIKGVSYDNSYPSFIYMNINDDDKIEWRYSGSFTGYSENYIKSPDLSEATSTTTISTNLAYYCAKITLPISDKFKIFTKYKKLGTTGDLKATMLSCRDSSCSVADGGANTCDFTRENSNFDTDNCEITFPYSISGPVLVCIFNAIGTEPSYEIAVDTSDATTTSFECAGPFRTEGITCGRDTRNMDFYILVQPGIYSGVLNTNVQLLNYFTNYKFNDSINQFLSTCIADATYRCTIPITVFSNSTGQIDLTNLNIIYRSGTLTSTESNFYDPTIGLQQQESQIIISINNTNLSISSANLTVPLSLFNLNAPVPLTSSKSFDLEIDINPGPYKTRTLTVSKSITTTTPISEIKNKLNTLLSEHSEKLQLLGFSIPSAINQLTIYESQLNALQNLTNQSATDKIMASVNSLKATLPESITLKEVVKDISVATPSDITDEIVLQDQKDFKTSIYHMQKQANINIEAESFSIKMFSGEVKEKTLIKKTITGNIQNGYIIEVIPKTIADDVNKIKFKENPEIVNSDPIVRWSFTSLNKEIIYILPINVLTQINDLKTIIIPNTIPESARVKAVCGDGQCSSIKIGDQVITLEDKIICPEDCAGKIPWLWIIVLLIVAVLAIVFLNFYKGKLFKEKPKEIKKPEIKPQPLPLFRTKNDEINLRNYVLQAIKYYKRPEITKKLLEKGWTNQQIDFIFNQIPEQKIFKPKN